MAEPWDDLSQLIVASDDLPSGTSVYSGPAPQIAPPAIVIRPGEPWITQDNAGFCHDVQHYDAICVVTASSPSDGVGRLYLLAKAIIDLLPAEGWSWDSVAVPVIDESTGTPLLAASVRLTYMNSEA